MKKSNMYDFATTWNPLAGECPHRCIYCSTNKFYYPVLIKKYSGDIRIDEKMLNKQPNKFNATIFVCAQTDLFANEVPKEFIESVLSKCNKLNVNYFFQTKNPKRFNEFKSLIPITSTLCCTIESDFVPNETYLGVVPSINERLKAMTKIKWAHKQITIEPIMAFFNVVWFAAVLKDIKPEQINIGVNTYKKVKLNEPTKKDVLQLISELEKFTVIYQKSNLIDWLNKV